MINYVNPCRIRGIDKNVTTTHASAMDELF